MISSSDISLVYSGGADNTNPNFSKGGEPSVYPITNFLNNLFDDATIDATNVDYRCFYVVNNNETDSFNETTFLISSQVEGGSSVEIGVETKTEIQQITISGTTTSGSFVLNYEGFATDPILYDADENIWATNIQNELNDLSVLSGIAVSVSGTTSARVFTLSFEGDDDSRFHELITITNNNLLGGVTVAIIKIQNGSPINATAPELDFDTDVPNNVVFGTENIEVGTLRAADFIPVWIRRTTEADIDPLQNDGFSFRISGSL